MKPFIHVLAIVALCCCSLAQQPASDTATQKTVIYAAHMLDVKTGKTLDKVTIVIAGDKIESITPGARSTAASGAKTIDLGEVTVLPGLIDAQTRCLAIKNWVSRFPRKR